MMMILVWRKRCLPESNPDLSLQREYTKAFRSSLWPILFLMKPESKENLQHDRR